MDDKGNVPLLVSVSAKSRKSLVPALTGLVHRTALEEGLTEEEAFHIEEAVEEACLNVISHAYEGRESEVYQIRVERPPGEFVVAVEDQGLPFDWERAGADASGLGSTLMKAFTDEVRFVNLGSRGKRLELIRRLGHQDMGIPPSESPLPTPQMAPLDAPLELRPMRPDETVALERCFYRTYGYTYADLIYEPQAVSESMEQGVVKAMVAATPEGEIVGHVAIVKETPSDFVGDLARAVVDPRYRRRAIFDRLAILLLDWAKEEGMTGLYSEAVTVHPATQKVLLKNDAVESGVLLGFIPSSFVFAGISEERVARSPIVLYYNKTNEPPDRVVYPPARHRPILKEIYEAIGIKRDFQTPPSASPSSEKVSEINVRIIHDFSSGTITVMRVGKDAAHLVRQRFKALCMQKVEQVTLELPLSDPGTPALSAAAEEMGFFFGGLIPELRNGDVLRLQYLNNAETIGGEENLVSPFGKKLYRYVLDCRD